MKIILIGNYPLDKQESMKRFTVMLKEGFKKKGIDTEIWLPVICFGQLFEKTTSGLGKWMGYIDKWLLFPVILKFRLLKETNRQARFHICDHSNAPYLAYLPKHSTGITCHDVLAIRGAFGYADAYCPASGMGKVLQRWILKYLSRAELLAAVSQFTLNQLKELSSEASSDTKKWVVIHNAFNAPFSPLSKAESMLLLKDFGIDFKEAFVLHVGSALERKNRKQLLLMVKHLGDAWRGMICFAGEALDPDLKHLIKDLSLEDRVISIVNPSHKQLVALYSSCQAFVFPSLSEGFGWPVIEAQACGTPVIASSLNPMPEVSGGAAIHVHPEDTSAFAEALLSLQNKDKRLEIIDAGFQNIKRFGVEKMIGDYLDLHQL